MAEQNFIDMLRRLFAGQGGSEPHSNTRPYGGLPEHRAHRTQTRSGFNPEFDDQASFPEMLRRMGVSLPEMRDSPIVSNRWMRTHPRAARALQNALFAAAATPPPSGPEGVGGGISRAVQGFLGGPMLEAAWRRRPMMEALDEAQAITGLRRNVASADLGESQAAYYRELPELRREQAELREQQQRLNTGQPIYASDGRLTGFFRPDPDSPAGARFFSVAELGVPETAARPAGAAGRERFNQEAFTEALIEDVMEQRFGPNRGQWPDVPLDVWRSAVDETTRRFRVDPSLQISGPREAGVDQRSTRSSQIQLKRMLDAELARIDRLYESLAEEALFPGDEEELASQREAEKTEARKRYDEFRRELGLDEEAAPAKGRKPLPPGWRR